MAITTATITDRAETILQDVSNVRWSAAELLDWLNAGQQEIVILKPEVNTKNESVQLTSGTKQTIPTGGIVLIDVVRNLGTDGTTVGNIITNVKRDFMDMLAYDWHTHTAKTVVRHYMFDDRDPTHYYVYPQSPGTNYIEIVYSKAPDTATTSITIPDAYANMLLDYILYRAFSKDSDVIENANRAVTHYNAFSIALSGKAKVESTNEPT